MRGAKLLSKILMMAVVSAVLSGGSALTAPYDESWYRAQFWSGEYPDGFSVAKSTTVQLRATPDRDAAQTIACDLPQGATYQPWNRPRVEEQGLAFVSFTKIAEYQMTSPFEATLYRNSDASEVKVPFKRGDTWRYLAYLGEGAFLMEHEGEVYDGDQALLEHAEQNGDTNGYEEWLRINCPNNQWGWLFMGDISLDSGSFVSPNITGYGESKDLE